MPQFFKGDDFEMKMYQSARPILAELSLEKSTFFDDAFLCFILGEVLYDTGRAPLANSIPRRIFRESFSGVFEAFIAAGSFESYLTVFRQVFGNDVGVVFTVPGPGKLNIDITATGIVVDEFVARRIEGDSYVLDVVVTHDGDPIGFQGVKGFESQYELEKMLFELVPTGIYTQITLTIGE